MTVPVAASAAVDPYLFASNSDSDDDGPSVNAAPSSFCAALPDAGAASAAVRWVALRIGDAVLEVSTEGQIKAPGIFQAANDGLPYPGTPYRVATVQHGASPEETSLFYVHDLVYQAFIGLPPPGWNVRHRNGNGANNALRNLTILPATVVADPILSAY